MLLISVPKAYSDDEIAKAIHTQNDSIHSAFPSFQTFQTHLKFVFHSKKRPEADDRNIVIEVSPVLRKLIKSLNRLRIKWFMIETRDHILVTRCFKCCGLGHRSDTCPHKMACSHCSKEHTFKNCPLRSDKTKLCCINCSNEKARTKNKAMDTNHSALSNDCPNVIHYKDTEFKRTDYG